MGAILRIFVRACLGKPSCCILWESTQKRHPFAQGAALSRDIPLFMALWHGRGEADRWHGKGACTETADCKRDQCKEDGGVSPRRVCVLRLCLSPIGSLTFHQAACFAQPLALTP